MLKNTLSQNINHEALAIIRQFSCVECGRRPVNASIIKPLSEGAPYELFNLMPLCIKHCHEHLRIGTIAFLHKYPNVKKHIAHKGWDVKNCLRHNKIVGDA